MADPSTPTSVCVSLVPPGTVMEGAHISDKDIVGLQVTTDERGNVSKVLSGVDDRNLKQHVSIAPPQFAAQVKDSTAASFDGPLQYARFIPPGATLSAHIVAEGAKMGNGSAVVNSKATAIQYKFH